MSDSEQQLFSPLDEPPIPRGHPWLAWVVIMAVAGWVVAQRDDADPQAKRTATALLHTTVGDWQARYFLGAAKMFQGQQSEALVKVAEDQKGPLAQQLRNVVLIGEIRGAKEAANKLDVLKPALKAEDATADDRSAAEALGRLYSDLVDGKTGLPSLNAADRETLVRTLGFSGQLALHPSGGPDEPGREELLAKARRTVLRVLVAIFAFFILGLVGLAALATVVLLLMFRPQMRALSPSTNHGGIYAETFAAWIVMYVALSYTARLLPLAGNPLLLSLAVMLASLAALAWPVLRGVPWCSVRQDIGLNLGRRPFVEPMFGVVAYFSAIPMVIAGLMIVAALMALARKLSGGAGLDEVPYHPIIGWLVKADWWDKLLITFLAAVMAPLVEETMFRGVLYRHLRDATSRVGYVGSVLVSALMTSFVFAGIHPQGWIAVPALMSLALAFTLAREWRGTLLPSMIAHGINNGLLTWALISMGSA